MIDLTNLMEYLPYFYKENDTYKDQEGKGLLERFLDICGNYFKDYPLKDMDNFFDNLNNFESIPELYLPYYWDFLGNFPFANTPILTSDEAKVNLSNFQDINEVIAKTAKVVIGSNPFSSEAIAVRDILKYSIALFRIRGSKLFFEVIFKLYNLEVTINDNMGSPSVQNGMVSTNHGTQSVEKFPTYDYNTLFKPNNYDEVYKYDEMVDCTQCLPVDFSVKVPGGVNEQGFKESVDKLIKYFIPFNATPIITFVGGTTVTNGIEISFMNGTNTDENNILFAGHSTELKVSISGPEVLYQVCASYDASKAPETGWSNSMDIRQVSSFYATFMRKLDENRKLQSLVYWVRLSQYPDTTSHISITQKEVSYEYSMSISVSTPDNEVVKEPIIDDEHRELILNVNLRKIEVVNSSEGPSNRRTVAPGFIFNEYEGIYYPESIEGQPDAGILYKYKVNRGGTYKFYAAEDPSTSVSITIDQTDIDYGVKLIPDRMYTSMTDGFKLYSDLDLTNQISEVQIIVYNSLDKPGEEKSVEGTFATLKEIHSSGILLSYFDETEKAISEAYPEGIPTETQLPVSLFKYPSSSGQPYTVEYDFTPLEGGLPGALYIEGVDTSLTWEFGLFDASKNYLHTDQTETYYTGDNVPVFAIKFIGNPTAVENKVKQLQEDDTFWVAYWDLDFHKMRLDLQKYTSNDEYTIYMAQNNLVFDHGAKDYRFNPEFDYFKYVIIKVTEAQEEVVGEPYLVIQDPKGPIVIQPIDRPYIYVLPSKDAKCVLQFEGRAYSGEEYEPTELDSIKDAYGNNYDTNINYEFAVGDHKFTIEDTKGKVYTLMLAVQPYAPTLTGISCSPETAELAEGKATTTVTFMLSDIVEDPGWNNYYVHHTSPEGLATTGKGTFYKNGSEFTATKAGEYYFAVVNDTTETTCKFTVTKKPVYFRFNPEHLYKDPLIFKVGTPQTFEVNVESDSDDWYLEPVVYITTPDERPDENVIIDGDDEVVEGFN